MACTLPKFQDGGQEMKKLIATVICLIALSVTAIPAGAQTRSRSINNRTGYDRRYDQRNDNGNRNDVYRGDRNRNDVYRNNDYRYDNYRNRSVWDQHRDKLTTAGGAVAGALLGGLAGGKKGAIIGALAGGGGAALYTYKLRNKDRRY
jgi:hypothetical protein